jgi:hypothetical protein
MIFREEAIPRDSICSRHTKYVCCRLSLAVLITPIGCVTLRDDIITEDVAFIIKLLF